MSLIFVYLHGESTDGVFALTLHLDDYCDHLLNFWFPLCVAWIMSLVSILCCSLTTWTFSVAFLSSIFMTQGYFIHSRYGIAFPDVGLNWLLETF